MPVIDLSGPDGNAFALMGYVRRWGKQLGMSNDTISEITGQMMGGDYNNLLTVMQESFDGKYLNEKNEGWIYLDIHFAHDPRGDDDDD